MTDSIETVDDKANLESLVEGGLGALFEDPEICAYIKEGLKEAGCRPPFHIILFSVLKKGAVLGWEFGGQALRSRLLALLARNERLSRWLDGVANVCRTREDRNRLKDLMLAHLRSELNDRPPPVIDDATDEEVLRQLYTRERFDAQDEQLGAIAGALQDLLVERSGDSIAPYLGWAEGGSATLADSIRYNSGLYDFAGREREMDLLTRFCSDVSMASPGSRFSWLLLTGPGGEGKTRLALEFTTRRILPNWRAGRLSLSDLKKFRHGEWLPAQPTMIVIDYPAQGPEDVNGLLSNLMRRHRTFDWPVRVLLLEREASGQWFETVVPQSGEGAGIRSHAFVCNGEQLLNGSAVLPIGHDSIAAMMESRFRTAGLEPPSRDVLLSAASKADTRRTDAKESPRPLFAAAVAEVIVAARQRGEEIDETWIAALAKENVLGAIIKRDRQSQWMPRADRDGQILELHENLVALATLAGGLDRSCLRRLPPETSNLLPDSATRSAHPLREELVQRMSGYEAGFIAPLEPDLLGEYFLLDRLEGIEAKEGPEARRQFCAAAFDFGGTPAVEVASRTAVDFIDRLERLEWLFPGGRASRCPTFATFLDRRLTSSVDDERRERLRGQLASDSDFTESVIGCGFTALSYWMGIEGFSAPVRDALRTATRTRAFRTVKTSDLELMWGLFAGEGLRDVRVSLWDEIFRRAEADPEFFDGLPAIQSSKFLRHANDDGRRDILKRLIISLEGFLERNDHSNAADLDALLHLGGLHDELEPLSAKAASALKAMVAGGRFPLSTIRFPSVVAANSMLKKHGFQDASASLKAMVDEAEDGALLMDVMRMSPIDLVHVFDEFGECAAFIAQLDTQIGNILPALFDHHLRGNIAPFASFVRTVRRRFPAREAEISTLIEERQEQIVEALRRSRLIEIAFAARYGSNELSNLIAQTLDQAEWDRRQPLSEPDMRPAAGLAHMLVTRGSVAFGQSLARNLAERASEGDLGPPPGAGPDDRGRILTQIWQVAGWCPDEALARSYLAAMRRRLARACMHEEAGLLADSIARVWSIPRERLDWVSWQPTLIGRIRKHLRGNDAHEKVSVETGFIRLLGATSVLLGAQAFALDLPLYMKRPDVSKLSNDWLLQHRRNATRIERDQYQYWLGLRCLDQFGGTPMTIDSSLLSETLKLWEVNAANDTSPVLLALDGEMIDWLRTKLAGTNP